MAEFVVTVPNPAAQRIKAAVAAVTGIGSGPASDAQVATLIVTYLRDLCRQVERTRQDVIARTATNSAVDADFS